MDAAPPPRRPRRPSAALAALLGWAVPGLGHVYAGRPRKGLFLAAVVLSTYLAGLALAGFRCVSWERDPFWFAAEAVAGLPTAIAWLATRDLPIDRRVPTYDVGLLYVAVSSLLNAVVVADALGLVDERLAAARAEEEAERRAAARDAALAAATVSRAGLAPGLDAGPAGSEARPEPPPLPRADVPDLGSVP